jgi:hypothetical protein
MVNLIKVPDNELDVKQLLRIYSIQINILIMKSIYVKLLRKIWQKDKNNVTYHPAIILRTYTDHNNLYLQVSGYNKNNDF